MPFQLQSGIYLYSCVYGFHRITPYTGSCKWEHSINFTRTGRGGRIDRTWASHAVEIGSHANQTNNWSNWCLSLPSLVMCIIRIGQGLVIPVSGLNNVIEWDIRSWWWWPDIPVSQHYKVITSVHFHKPVPFWLDVARMEKSNNQQLLLLLVLL